MFKVLYDAHTWYMMRTRVILTQCIFIRYRIIIFKQNSAFTEDIVIDAGNVQNEKRSYFKALIHII